MECMTKVIHFDYSMSIFKSKKRAHIWPKVKAQTLSSHFSSQLSRKHFKCNLKRILNITIELMFAGLNMFLARLRLILALAYGSG